MTLETILPPERVLFDVPGGSKKRVLEFYSTFIAQNIPSLDSQEVFSRLIGRERLGSTGIGNGVAIPHARSPHCNAPIAGFLKLAEAIDFDAIDGDPVDLVFVLLVPEEADDTHLSLLGQVATIMNDADTRQQLRKAASQRELLELITAKIREQSAA
ncbi:MULTISPECIES: PTS sugar transporter subunit IIA [Halomonadaceae]|jgi:PTS system nitrogen regulatory IIA component|uniref:Nitrogen regulatory protein n=1 Tax=Vreelandella titanicae TaxID=664683 RepID=A0A6N0YVY7_9GAMM|nr:MULTISPECIES: PTS sugar transporter subunit IIA [Halomonas]NAO97393.1 PTS fructose transporter subunit IIA [Halomonas sp. MG34]UEQ05915.1 PTS sugar transporter subunit IIA [Halomonas profundus]KIN16568.1 PTS fructose transporter subunit IIA [Halomonas sp. KHS3]MCD1585364.1 PTS sugar transporter subunit IIA [Halomonas sp. IOP_14]NVE89448.1 PTS sugar transporter subunit IIA [Halomonas titanicae]|tara:strand:- start:1006 stop:1476 length:471 start_codon:yes stop_codon:yes gene_type:complete|eukprot:TRINITY_DN22723_c0_g1_i1.p1 TRINITY_DN22723_c0_g1~~TRINITY_DN22723_c0_g1_i1.p1  ORF type:complete len:157 (+),score=10.18 TRINITY_DN22723_c0_g1_i1:376-846(+)